MVQLPKWCGNLLDGNYVPKWMPLEVKISHGLTVQPCYYFTGSPYKNRSILKCN